MSNTHTVGQHAPRVADFQLLSTLPNLANVEISTDGSALATSMLGVPNAFSEATAALLFDTVPLAYFSPRTENLIEYFEELIDKENEEAALEDIDTGDLELVLDLWVDDQEAAAIYFQSISTNPEDRRELGELEAVKMLRAELEADTGDVTVGQLQLLGYAGTAMATRYAFPKASAMFDYLTAYEPELTAAEKRVKDRRDRAERFRVEGAGNRRRSSVSDLENMIMLGEEPVALAAMALNTPNVKNDQLLDILEEADPTQIRDWLFAREVVKPQAGQVTELVKRLSDDRIDELIHVSQLFLEESSRGWGGAVYADLPHIFEIIEHVYLPHMVLTPATATIVFHELNKRIGDDPSTWAAVLLADTGGQTVRYEDLTL